jgi:hypothetical protein
MICIDRASMVRQRTFPRTVDANHARTMTTQQSTKNKQYYVMFADTGGDILATALSCLWLRGAM